MNDRGPMPSLGEIAEYWRHAEDAGQLRETFTRSYLGDWGETFCFRCRWQAPVRGYGEDYWVRRAARYRLDDEALYRKIWDKASGWLERCHVHEHVFGGGEEAHNLVPMCPACHRWQPACESREDGLAYVNAGVYAPQFLPHTVGAFPCSHKAETYFRYLALHFQLSYEALVEDVREAIATESLDELYLPAPSSWPTGAVLSEPDG